MAVMTRPAYLLLIPLLLLSACVRRELTITSEPPGALVYLNDLEVGRTPLKRNFTFYGNYDVQLRLDGFQTLNTNAKIIAPWWQWVPFDLLAEALPLTDRKSLHYQLSPIAEEQEDPAYLLGRAEQMKATLPPVDVAATQPATQPTTQP